MQNPCKTRVFGEDQDRNFTKCSAVSVRFLSGFCQAALKRKKSPTGLSQRGDGSYSRRREEDQGGGLPVIW